MKMNIKTSCYLAPCVTMHPVLVRSSIFNASTFSGSTTPIEDDYEGFGGSTGGEIGQE